MPDNTPRSVLVVSPLHDGELGENVIYAHAVVQHSIAFGEHPTWGDPDSTDAWDLETEALVVYDDLGVTPIMFARITQASARGLPIEFRSIGDDPPHPLLAPEDSPEEEMLDDATVTTEDEAPKAVDSTPEVSSNREEAQLEVLDAATAFYILVAVIVTVAALLTYAKFF